VKLDDLVVAHDLSPKDIQSFEEVPADLRNKKKDKAESTYSKVSLGNSSI
jgi:hypothetical protein